MLRIVAAISVSLLLVGCAPTVLFDRSTKYNYTFDEIEDRIILENLARYIDDENRIPSLGDFKQGSVQATDNLSVGATVPYTAGFNGASKIFSPQVFNLGAAQVQSQDNWTYTPVTDVEDLGRTRCLYKFVISQARRPGLTWPGFSKSCKVGGKSFQFPYSPPPQPWFTWTPAEERQPPRPDYVLFGTFRSYALWGDLAAFHDFELVILGSIPNTAGAAGTTKVAAPAGAALTILSEGTAPKFESANQKLIFTYRIRNTGNSTLQNIIVTSTKVPAISCEPKSLAVNEAAKCQGTYQTTDSDLSCFNDWATAAGNVGDGSGASQAVSAVVETKYCPGAQPKTTFQTTTTPPSTPEFRFFIPGKSSTTTIVPPMAAPNP
jgi:uncharacterized repeat protein (TIGR01451 family)